MLSSAIDNRIMHCGLLCTQATGYVVHRLHAHRRRPLAAVSAQPRQLLGRPAAHRAQDLNAHALAQAQLPEVGVAAQEQRVEADMLLGPAKQLQGSGAT